MSSALKILILYPIDRLNKTDLKSYNKGSDACCAFVYGRRVINYSGFVEVKAEYKKKNSICLHEDLLRLSLFGMNALEETNAKCILLLQIIGKVNLNILFTLCL